MSEPNNEETINPQQAPDTGHDGKLAAEAARRRVQAREASERADAAEQEAAQLRAQIAELRLSQARQAVTAKHPELTSELIEKFAPDNVDADSLADWADKSMQLVVALRGEAPVDADTMSDTERELAAAQMELARSKAVSEHEHVTDEVLDTLCTASTPEGVAAWAAAFEQVVANMGKAKPVHIGSSMPEVQAAIRANQIGGGKMKDTATGLKHVAQKLTNR